MRKELGVDLFTVICHLDAIGKKKELSQAGFDELQTHPTMHAIRIHELGYVALPYPPGLQRNFRI